MRPKPTVEEQLTAMIPKRLDDVIRKQRDLARLRFSTQDDLDNLWASVPADE